MNRYDDYGLNKNESWIYRMAQTILLESDREQVNKKIVDEAVNEAIELGLNRRITNDFNANLVRIRLYNWYAVN